MEKDNHSFIERLKEYIPTRRKKLRSLLILTGIILFATKVTEWSSAFSLPAIIIMLPGMALHLWTKGHLHQNKVLTKTGPYRWVRNPFYLADALIDLALCLLIHSIIVGIAYLAIWVFVYLKTIRREEKTLEGIFGDDFIDYKSKVPCLIPYRFPLHSVVALFSRWVTRRSRPRDPAAAGRVRPIYEERGLPAEAGSRLHREKPSTTLLHHNTSATGFSWQNPNIAQGKEISRLLSFACLPLLFYCLSGIIKDGMDFTFGAEGNMLALSMFILLVWLTYSIQIILKEKKPALPGWTGINIVQYIFMIIFLDGLFFINYLPSKTGTIILQIILLSSILLLVFILLSPKRLWLRFRFYSMIRCIIAVLLSFLAEQPWLALFPLGYYIPWIIYGERKDSPSAKRLTSLLITIGFLLIGVGLMMLKAYSESGMGISSWFTMNQ